MKTVTTSATQRKSWQECPVKWGWKYLARIEAPKGAALTLGGAVHKGLEAWYSRKGIVSALQDACEHITLYARPDDAEELLAICRGLLITYFRHYKSDMDKYEVIATEHEFVVPLGQGYKDHGFVDLVLRDKADQSVWVLETKTRQQLQEQWITILPLDHQINRYLDVLHGEGLNPSGVIYNIVRKPSIRVRKDEDPQDYGIRLIQDIQSRPEFYFLRTHVLAGVMDSAHHRECAHYISREIGQAQRGTIPLIPSDGACLRAGMACEFLPLCSAGQKPTCFDPHRVPPGFRVKAPQVTNHFKEVQV